MVERGIGFKATVRLAAIAALFTGLTASAGMNQPEETDVVREAERLGLSELVARTGLSEAEQRRLSATILREAKENALDPLLVAAVIHCESSFRVRAVSSVGARGLMQVMPATGRWLAEKRGLPYESDAQLFDFELNVKLGAGYLADLIERFDSVAHALVAYNAGPTAARRILANEAKAERFLAGYPAKVIQTWDAYRDRHDTTHVRSAERAAR